mgnify:CR=1 FL=1
MLRVTEEMIPFGEEAHKRTITEITASLRMDSDLPTQGNYDVEVKQGSSTPMRFVIRDHCRVEGALTLVQLILQRIQGCSLAASGQRERQQLAKKHGYTIREDGRVERICEHGVGHTIGHLDAAREAEPYMFIHGCCCNKNGVSCCAEWPSFSEEIASDKRLGDEDA